MDELLISAPSITSANSYGKAIHTIERLCIKEIVYLENLAEYHEEQFANEEYSHTEKAKQLRSMAQDVRAAMATMNRGV
tara:strand:+ start:146 stop:382 length:237 start_codon:yes stop_codon:yes gene_type:complete